jgi:PTH1 family peptidyl-tRNA hydrolase
MKYFFGLGNLGKLYEKNRHNIGHQFIAKLKLLELPHTKTETNTGYMNEAGLSAQKFVHYYKINLNNFYLIHDDLDLPVGEYRLQFDRGPAGHHGVESVIAHVGTQAFNRIRIGIGKPPEHVAVEDFVLQNFSKEEKIIISETFDKILTDMGL